MTDNQATGALANPIQRSLQFIMEHYHKAREAGNRQATGLAGCEQALRASELIERLWPPIEVRWSRGAGDMPLVPWVQLLDPHKASGAKRGVYIVYLFRQDMSGVYLTLNQGVSALREDYGREGAHLLLKQQAAELRKSMAWLVDAGFALDGEVDLRSYSRLAKDYEYGTVACKLYERDRVPEDARLLADLESLLTAYSNVSDDVLGNSSVTSGSTGAEAAKVERAPSDGVVLPHSVSPVALTDLLQGSLVASGLQYDQWQIAAFFTALQAKGFVILSGISGIGKTRLVQHFAGLFPEPIAVPGPSGEEMPLSQHNWLFLTVRPDWRDSKSLLGYYNPLTASYEWTPFLRFLLRATRNFREAAPSRLPWFVILDEMNLAHVEYYFADLLSVLESGRDANGLTREAIQLTVPADAEGELPPPDLRLPPNLYIVGTVNVDETTHAFSPKVLDRAFSIELSEVDFSRYLLQESVPFHPSPNDRAALLAAFTAGGRFPRVEKAAIAAYAAAHPEVQRWLQVLNEHLRPYMLHFGYRVFDEIVAFQAAAEHNQLFVELAGAYPALDAAVLMKVLPKFHGSRGRLEAPLLVALAWCLSPDLPDQASIDEATRQAEPVEELVQTLAALPYLLPHTARRVLRMLQELYVDGFTAFG